jgi:hypothetical protein
MTAMAIPITSLVAGIIKENIYLTMFGAVGTILEIVFSSIDGHA